MNEIWKPVIEFEGLYEVSNLGRVKSLRYRGSHTKNDVLAPVTGPHNYKQVHLHKDKEISTRYIHRLVAQAFIPNPDGLPEINHMDENPANNHVDNLEWCTSKYNKNYGHRAEKMAAAKVGRFRGENAAKRTPVVCVETGKHYPTMRMAADDVGCSYSKISLCCSGKRKTTGGYHWRYAEEVNTHGARDSTCLYTADSQRARH